MLKYNYKLLNKEANMKYFTLIVLVLLSGYAVADVVSNLSEKDIPKYKKIEQIKVDE
jgi:hypothetical protein